PRALNVRRLSAGDRGDDGAVDLARDRRDVRELRVGRPREARLDHVHPHPLQGPRDLELRGAVKRDARRLLAVAQRRVEDQTSVSHVEALYGPARAGSVDVASPAAAFTTAFDTARR